MKYKPDIRRKSTVDRYTDITGECRNSKMHIIDIDYIYKFEIVGEDIAYELYEGW